MQLTHVDINGFRGISQLSLSFDALTVLIGENTWGKSSLLDALSIALSPMGTPYLFTERDFYLDYNNENQQCNQLQILLQLQESFPRESSHQRYRDVQSLFISHGSVETADLKKRGLKTLYYRLTASLENGKIETQYSFLDANGDPIVKGDSNRFAMLLMRLHPIIRMRDSRRLRDDYQPIKASIDSEKKQDRLKKRLDHTYNRLISRPGEVNQSEIKQGMNAVVDMLSHYFAFAPHHRKEKRDSLSTETPSLGHTLMANLTQSNQLVFMGLINSYIRSLGEIELSPTSRPILIFEEPESRLHPILLKQLLSFLNEMPMQKIFTTNSSELLAKVDLYSLRHLVRRHQYTESYQVTSNRFNHNEKRLIDFHIHQSHPHVLFARTWLLVEGETEVWIFNALAEIMGYGLSTEGIEIIQFAQSGLKNQLSNWRSSWGLSGI